MRLYMSGGALMLLAFVYLPIVLLLLWRLWRKLPAELSIRIFVTVVAVIVAAAIPLWDVAITSVQMARLCPSAGLKVYKTVQVRGYLTNFSGNLGEIRRRGYSYIETQSAPGKISVFTKEGGSTVETVIDPKKNPYKFRSRYEYRYGSPSALEDVLHVAAARSVVLDRTTGKPLGEAVTYTAFPGWVDRNTIQLFGNFGWSCPEDTGIHADVVARTLRPMDR